MELFGFPSCVAGEEGTETSFFGSGCNSEGFRPPVSMSPRTLSATAFGMSPLSKPRCRFFSYSVAPTSCGDSFSCFIKSPVEGVSISILDETNKKVNFLMQLPVWYIACLNKRKKRIWLHCGRKFGRWKDFRRKTHYRKYRECIFSWMRRKNCSISAKQHRSGIG